MCGRYAIISAPDAIRRLFGYADQPNFPPRYNVAPTQPIPVVRLARDQAEWEPVSRPDRAQNSKVGARTADKFTQSAQARLLSAKPVPTFADRAPGKRRFALVRWGLIPAWVKDPKTFTLLINARAESVNDKPAFRNAMKYRRCLIPADGFYEWQRVGASKRPFFVSRKGGAPFAFAGLWESWSGPNGEEMETAAIVTTAASRSIAHIHERMPVMIEPEAFDLWLDCGKVDAQTAAALLTPLPDAKLQFHEVSTAVNRVANDGPELIAPVHSGREAVCAGKTPDEESAVKAPKRRAKKSDGQASLF